MRSLLILLAAALPLVLARTPKGPSLTFGLFADWGFGPNGDYTTQDDLPNQQYWARFQAIVARDLGMRCEMYKCSFVLNGGDNFYSLGIDKATSVYDPQWSTSFYEVYSHPYLQKLPIYGCLGNHEYGASHFVQSSDPSNYGTLNESHSIWPQIEMTYYRTGGQWRIPYRYYQEDVSAHGIKAHLTVIDSSPLCQTKYCDQPDGTEYYGPDMTQNCQPAYQKAQLEFMASGLDKAKNSGAWSIAMGHHPIISVPDGLYDGYAQNVAKVLAEHKPDLWVSGHDHTTAHYTHPNVTDVQFYILGAGGACELGDGILGPQSQGLQDQYNIFDYILSHSGYAIFTLYEKEYRVQIFTADLANDLGAPFKATFDKVFPKVN
jgi:hypothetical protein